MFDIEEYYNTNRNNTLSTNLNEEIELEIDSILKQNALNQYSLNTYKLKKHFIDIYCPIISFQGAKKLLKNSDYFRFVLSIYPDKRDLQKINRILYRPKYISSENTELVSLFIHKTRTLVIYLFYPHYYNFIQNKFKIKTKFMPFDLSTIADNNSLGLGKKDSLEKEKYDPLFYILSTISVLPNNGVDKFFLRIKKGKDYKIVNQLEEISSFYFEHGY